MIKKLSSQKEKTRPTASEFKQLEKSTKWKDDNVLREYQFEGVSWLLYCYHNQSVGDGDTVTVVAYRQNCILADEMGLGKTVQTITFLQGVWE